jgi:sialic acid synthase SpsE
MGKEEYAHRLIDLCVAAKADVCKFQLFPKEMAVNGNVRFPLEWVEPILNHGKSQNMKVAFSVFSPTELEWLLKFPGIPWIKFAHSQRHSPMIPGLLRAGHHLVISMSPEDIIPPDPHLTRLFCIPQYPVLSTIHWEGIFPLFDGFSDHTIGLGQSVEAYKHGCRWFEKHIKLDYQDVTCPDAGLFSLNQDRAIDYVQVLRDLDTPDYPIEESK